MTVNELVDTFDLEVYSGREGLDREITDAQLTRPGIELAGLFDFFEHKRVQIFGSKEVTFFGWLQEEEQESRVEALFRMQPPAFIFSKHVEPPEVFLRKGGEHNIAVLKSHLRTSELFSRLYQHLSSRLAPRESIHGTLVDINGVGVLIKGSSGIGKSEVALELVRRGHQLVADDRVDVFELEEGLLIGEAPPILRENLEIRGVGIVNVVKLFGASAFKETKAVTLLVELIAWREGVEYDRLGLDTETKRMFQTDVPFVQIPTTAARNVPTLIEAAAMNARLKALGTDMAEEFTEAVSREIERKSDKSGES